MTKGGHDRRRSIMLAMGAGMLMPGCLTSRPRSVDFSENLRDYRGRDYARVRDSWTRHAREVRDFGMVIEAWATFKGSDFRQAYVERYADLYGLSEAEKTALRLSQLEAAKSEFEFHLTTQSTEYAWNDLEKVDSSWRIRLLDGTGAALRPTSVAAPKLPEPYEREFFPSRTPFTRTYVAKFSRTDTDTEGRVFAGTKSGRLSLRIAGPLGAAELVWESRPGAG